MRSSPAFQRLQSEFYHEIGNKRWGAAFSWRAIGKVGRPGGSFMNNSDAYRANAKACARLAEVISDLPDKLVLLNMAEAWLRLADYVERREQNE